MFLIDTNVISELTKRKPDEGVLTWFPSVDRIVFSAITIEELSFGIERAKSEQRTRLRVWFEKLLAVPVEVIPVDDRIAKASGALRASRESAGFPVAQADMLIAATALVTGRTLATRNTRDFGGCGVQLFNPFLHVPTRKR